MTWKLKLTCGKDSEGYSVKKKEKRYRDCVPPVNDLQTGLKGGLYFVNSNSKKKYLQKGAKVIAKQRQKNAEWKINKTVANRMPDLEEHDNQ